MASLTHSIYLRTKTFPVQGIGVYGNWRILSYVTKKPKVHDNRYWRKKATTLAKKIVRHKANYTCAYCGATHRVTHGSHVFAEGKNNNMSADLDNILCLCAYHHAMIPGRRPGDWNWHAYPAESILWFQRKYPQRWERLKDRSNSHYKLKFENHFKKLKEMADELGI